MAARNYVSTALPTVLAADLGASGNPSVISLPGTWPASFPYPVLLDWGTSAQEAILVTSAPTGTGPYSLPCTRGIDNTTAQAHSAGAQAEHGTTGYEPTQIQALLAAIAALAIEIPSLPTLISQGGTGETTRQAAVNALAGAVTSGEYLRGNGTNVAMSALLAADLTGAVDGGNA